MNRNCVHYDEATAIFTFLNLSTLVCKQCSYVFLALTHRYKPIVIWVAKLYPQNFANKSCVTSCAFYQTWKTSMSLILCCQFVWEIFFHTNICLLAFFVWPLDLFITKRSEKNLQGPKVNDCLWCWDQWSHFIVPFYAPGSLGRPPSADHLGLF